MTEQWYRYVDVVYSGGVSEHGDAIPGGPHTLKVHLRKFDVAKITPKGVRLDNGRFVLSSARRRFACPTIDEARQSFIARKKAQIRIYSDKLACAERALQIIKQEKELE